MRRTCLLLCLALLLTLPLTAEAVDMRVTSSTQFLWFNDFFTGNDDEMFAQYLKLNMTGLNPENTLTIQGYGRITYLSTDAADSEDLLGRLYYLYVDYRDVVKNVDVTAGRHFVNLPAGSALIDGATLNVRNAGPLDLRVLGGRNVIFSGDRNEITGDGDTFMGASVSTDAIKLTHLEAGYARKTDDANDARETAGISFTTYLPLRIAVYGEAKYDLIAETTSELLAGIKVSPMERLTVTGEYYESYPTFDATSIYSVFAVSQYKEKVIKADYAVTDNYRVFLALADEDFNDDEDATRYEAGITARPISDLVLNLSYDKRNGYGGELDGIRFNGKYSVTQKTSVSAGIDWDDFRRDSFTDETAKKYWVGGNHRLTETVSVMVRAEDNVNVRYDHQYQGVAAINAEF